MNVDQMRFLENKTLVSKSRRQLFIVSVTMIALAAAIMVFGALHWSRIQNEAIDRYLAGSVSGSWELAKKDVATRLWAFSKLIAVDDHMLPYFGAGRRDQLQAAIAPWFQTLHGNRQLVRLDFISGDRRVFLRASHPGEYGDLVDAAPLKEAERTREATTGLVAGRGGIEFDLVVPLLQKGKITGYVALGMDVESLLKDLKEVAHADFLLLLRKDLPDFQAAADTVPGHKGWHPADWSRFPDVVVAAATRPGLVDGLTPGQLSGEGDVVFAPSRLRVVPVAITDPTGSVIGRLDALLDDGERQRIARLALATFLLATLAVGGLAVAIGYLLLYRLQPALQMSVGERQNMERMSMRDGLTGLYNRGALDALLHKEMVHAHEANLPLSLMIVTLDDYRQGDDKKERGLDDKVILAVADTLQHQLRLGDAAVRYTGNGFALVVQRVGGALARDVAERIRRAVGGTKVEVAFGLVAVSACIGVGCYPEHGKAPADLVRAAEKALMSAKGQGRGQVRVAENEPR